MPDHGSPSVRRRRLAAELKRLREERNYTGDKVAKRFRWSTSKISRIENSRTGIKPADRGRLLGVNEITGDHPDELLDLAREPARRRKGWWEAYSDVLPEWYAGYVIIESEADSISCWSPEIVTGLLQTEDYALAVSDIQGSSASSPSKISRRVQARLRRQDLLTGDRPTRGTFVLDESVLLHRSEPTGAAFTDSPKGMQDLLAGSPWPGLSFGRSWTVPFSGNLPYLARKNRQGNWALSHTQRPSCDTLGHRTMLLPTPRRRPMSHGLSRKTVLDEGAQNDYSAAPWRTNSFCGPNGPCVEFAELPGGNVGVRDSKDPASPVLRFTPAEWRAFIAGPPVGEFGNRYHIKSSIKLKKHKY